MIEICAGFGLLSQPVPVFGGDKAPIVSAQNGI